MRIVILDGYTTNPGDLNWQALASLGELVVYEHTSASETVERASQAEIVISNKTVLGSKVIEKLPNLRYIGLLSTGCTVVDLQATRRRGIPVTNIPAYSTQSVAQLVFALLLELTNHVQSHSDSVFRGDWARSRDFCYWNQPQTELAGKTMGIVGYGQIGQAVARIAQAFGMQVLVCGRPSSQKEKTLSPGLRLTSFEAVLEGSDAVSLHCPLTNETRELINRHTLERMKSGALLINTSRGSVLNETEVAEALRDGRLGGFAADVLSTEPPSPRNPLLRAPNCLLTPHIAWATYEARARLIAIAAQNLAAFLNDAPVNVVN
ncbi:MAG: D-2-hydroxyacid dehydrogenase [Oscillospiraceae bacterium]|jgi:glycerate dehydrogenase|nr:D-2-hydroxyacid dehydrogenase [Oscillospiraceae bacterium]